VINRIQLIRNIGQFESVNSIERIQLQRFVLIYAENGRGKTTLTAVLRSLATGDPVPITERRRLGAQHPPHVILDCAGGPPSAIFQLGQWSRNILGIVIFDDRFIDENVYSGLAVDPEHRQNMHQLVLGSQGVALNQQLQDSVRQVELDNAAIRRAGEFIPATALGGLSIDQFCALPPRPDIDEAILAAERALAAARQQEPIRLTQPFDQITLPAFDIPTIEEILSRDLPALDEQAAALVQAHIAEIGINGESWIANGLERTVERADAVNTCPFCAQDLTASPVIAHYRAYFSEEYSSLKQAISDAISMNTRLHGGDVPISFERAVRVAVERQQFWSRFAEVPEIALDTATLVNDWLSARECVGAALESKRNAPLERMALSPEDIDAIHRFNERREQIAVINQIVADANRSILTIKDEVASADPRELLASLNRLKAVKARHEEPVSTSCNEYLAAQTQKVNSEAAREQAKRALEQYRTTVFPTYQTAINDYLDLFNADFRIGRVVAADTRGGPTCNYDIVVRNTSVAVAGGASVRGVPSFGSVLSAGDRNALALAFFFASLDREVDPTSKIVVIDDPVSSLDEHRALTTIQVLRRTGQRVSQLIILSHSKTFLCSIYEGIDPTLRIGLKIERDTDGSTLALWDVNRDLVSEHDRRHSLLRSFVDKGPNNNSFEVASSIRPHLEAFLRVAFPEVYVPGTLLGPFLRICRHRYGNPDQILDHADMQELEDIKEFANRFHHDTNPAWRTEHINDRQLQGFVTRTLRLARR
jgi:wobble nucleotide-excising tRNase